MDKTDPEQNLRTCHGKEKIYTVRGISVKFPYNAYPSQLSMMNKILSGLLERKNCLLESPTGSGKSLALLCSSLAWQKRLKEAYILYQDSVNQSIISEDAANSDANTSLPKGLSTIKRFYTNSSQAKPSATTDSAEFDSAKAPPEKPPVIFYCTRTHKQIKQIISEMRKCPEAKTTKMTILSSREHSCIYEEGDEGPRGGGGKFSGMSKNERCKKLRDSQEEGECSYHQGLMAALRDPFRPKNAKRLSMGKVPWDIEDLTKHGMTCKICPFYLSRELQKSAEFILCPYNYIIDPRIRNTMHIELQDNVIILDEAHNIEDVARSAGSCTATHDELDSVFQELNFILDRRAKVRSDAVELYETVKQLISTVCSCSLTYGFKLAANQFQEATKVFTGADFVRLLEKNFSIDQECFEEILNAILELAKIEGEDDDAADESLETSMNTSSSNKKKGGVAKLSTDAWAIIETISVSMQFLFKSCSDFRVVFVKKYDRNRPSKLERKNSKSNSLMSQSGGWMGKNQRTSLNSNKASWQQQYSKEDYYEVIFNIWCMSPATVFRDLTDKARCIILASGTLSPLDTFASELGCAFPVVLEAPHVINKTQIWTGAVGKGFNSSVSLRATFQNTQQLAFQDEVGNVLLEICKIIPHGILFFLPSYKLLSMLIERWKTTGLYFKLQDLKSVFQEPQKGGSSELNEVVKCFSLCIASSKTANDQCERNAHGSSQPYEGYGAKGALFIAVCRGKVSEGIDFADEQARAVVTLGIPFPNIKDIQVELKRKFNDENVSTDRKLLSGSDWYEVQAFRALNQALGRCIRHRNDWGAVILLDDRFAASSSSKYTKSLPKWIRGFFRPPENLTDTLKSLEAFVESQIVPIASNPATKSAQKTEPRALSPPDVKSCSSISEANTQNLANDEMGDVVKKTELPKKAFNFAASNSKSTQSGLSNIGVKRRTVKYNHGTCKTSTPLSGKTTGPAKTKAIDIGLDERRQRMSDSSEECVNIPESPDLHNAVPFKYPKHGAEISCEGTNDQSDDGGDELTSDCQISSDCSGPESLHLESVERSKNSDVLCKSTFPEGSNELFDDSSIDCQFLDDVNMQSKAGLNQLRCCFCEKMLCAKTEAENGGKNFRVFDSLNATRRKQIRSSLQSFLPEDVFNKFSNFNDGEDGRLKKSLYLCDEELIVNSDFHLRPLCVETQANVNLNCQFCEDLQIVWQPLFCEEVNDRSSSIAGVRVIHCNPDTSLPKFLFWAFTT